jgi:hypothetical protein
MASPKDKGRKGNMCTDTVYTVQCTYDTGPELFAVVLFGSFLSPVSCGNDNSFPSSLSVFLPLYKTSVQCQYVRYMLASRGAREDNIIRLQKSMVFFPLFVT